ncbi:UPF0051 protein ABCI8 [Hibiscus syriacus]|uniref:UPF0051 protein ABCI8 n=1 Tax=Hibiscus syriacus TaxID=106335 RepID=A0A6A3A076_HIBSY|nr:UPF0051 protein ABCI8 [Hibiscus syriacus]
MSSLLANGISSFSPQPTPDTIKLPKVLYLKLDFVKPIIPKYPNSSLFKVRADVGFDPQTLTSDPSSSSALNNAVFSDGSFSYIPKDTKCPMSISTYSQINELETGQFERTLIVADEGSSVEYLEGCTAPSYDRNQLHSAVFELHCAEGAEIKYSTMQNWYAGDEEGKGGIYNFFTKRGLCAGDQSKISWTQVETGSAITYEYGAEVNQLMSLKLEGSVG